VFEHRRAADVEEIRLGPDDEPPVRRITQGGRDVRAQLFDGVPREHRRIQHGTRQHEEQRRQQPPRPPQVEAFHVDPARATRLGQQQRRDQKSGDDEEDVHPEETARQPGRRRVVRYDAAHGDRP
jgi:hypothetical protein